MGGDRGQVQDGDREDTRRDRGRDSAGAGRETNLRYCALLVKKKLNLSLLDRSRFNRGFW